MIYLDNASTTKMKEEVLAEMMPYLTEEYGNPGSVHELGLEARKAVDLARQRVAKAINAEPDEIIFTSGGSEANNMMIHGMFGGNIVANILSSCLEHDSMLKVLRNSFHHVNCINYFDQVNLCQEVARQCEHEDIDVVSLMYVNNEFGFANPVYEIGKIAEKRNCYAFVSDCVQALGSEYIDVKKMKANMISLSSHKVHGPKGVGALYIEKDFQKVMEPLIYGGGNQEFGLRGGTENVAGIVGFGKACELINVDRNKTTVLSLKNRLKVGIESHFTVNFDSEVGKILSLTSKVVDAETLVLMLASKGVYVSAGSACKSLSQEPNKVLLAAGLTEEEARHTIRISLSELNTVEEIDAAIEIINDCVGMLEGCVV